MSKQAAEHHHKAADHHEHAAGITRKPQSTMKQGNTKRQHTTRILPGVTTNTRCTTRRKRHKRGPPHRNIGTSACTAAHQPSVPGRSHSPISVRIVAKTTSKPIALRWVFGFSMYFSWKCAGGNALSHRKMLSTHVRASRARLLIGHALDYQSSFFRIDQIIPRHNIGQAIYPIPRFLQPFDCNYSKRGPVSKSFENVEFRMHS
jgi:hypothetical protein